MTRYVPVVGQAGAEWLVKDHREAIVIVFRHGLGDLVFFSPCFELLKQRAEKVYLVGAVNAYTTLYHESPYVTPLYLGGTNGNGLKLDSAPAFAGQLDAHGIDLGTKEAFVYHYGLFEPKPPYTDPTAFVKGRRNQVEFGWPGTPATDVPRYHVAPDRLSKAYVDAALDRWRNGRELIVLVRYGHTDAGKNICHSVEGMLSIIDGIERAYHDRFCFLSFDYVPGAAACEGFRRNVRSIYGFLPCDAAAMHHVLSRARLMVTVPTGAMLVGATIPTLKMLTVWRQQKPYHFLDPQFSSKVTALVQNESLASVDFAQKWSQAERASLQGRWNICVEGIDPETISRVVLRMLKEES